MAVKENFLGFNLYATGVVMTSILWFFSSNGKGWEADKKHGKRK
jgi:hypothetical protein